MVIVNYLTTEAVEIIEKCEGIFGHFVEIFWGKMGKKGTTD